ncbi:hypothetical protein [Variovorax gossypii]
MSRLARKEGGSIFDGNRGSGFHGTQHIEYDLGYFGIHDDRITLYHDDIPELMARFLAMPKFQQIFTGSYPVVLSSMES